MLRVFALLARSDRAEDAEIKIEAVSGQVQDAHGRAVQGARVALYVELGEGSTQPVARDDDDDEAHASREDERRDAAAVASCEPALRELAFKAASIFVFSSAPIM